MKIKVIQIIDALNAGGAEILAINIANNLNDDKFESFLCTSRKKGEIYDKLDEKVKTIALERKAVIDLKENYRFYKFLKKNNINIIHAHSTSIFFSCMIKIMRPSIKVIWHDHNGDREQLKIRKKSFLKLASFFFRFYHYSKRQINFMVKKNTVLQKSFDIR